MVVYYSSIFFPIQRTTKKWQSLPIDFPNRILGELKMKHKLVVSMLTAIVIFAATTVAEAGIFGRLSVVWNGCNPCEQVACQPCEPIACQPCEPACDPCGSPCGIVPCRPFGGFFANVKSRLASVCTPSCCNPCEPVACEPCEPICDPCGGCAAPFRPFGGFFQCLKSKLAFPCVNACNPCEPVCDPCAACR